MWNGVDWPLDSDENALCTADVFYVKSECLKQGKRPLYTKEMQLALEAHKRGEFGDRLDAKTLQGIVTFVSQLDEDMSPRKLHSRAGAILVHEGETAEFESMVTFVARSDPEENLLGAIRFKIEFIMQLLCSQPHRLYVRTLFTTNDGKKACLVQFDYSGAAHSEWIDICADPEDFIWLIFAVISPDKYVLGLDSAVKYGIKDGKKVGGTMSIGGVQYSMVDPKPISTSGYSRGIFDQPTTIYRLMNEGCQYFFKTTWYGAPDRGADEPSKLERAKGIPGVVQMVSSNSELTTDELRGITTSEDEPWARRVQILFEYSGPPITSFTSKAQLLGAFIDVFQAILDLYEKAGLMHGNITPANIVLGPPDAPRGQRGKLINLDMALETREQNMTCIRGGTLEYMSIETTKRFNRQPDTLPHSPFDDLESGFYVLLKLMGGTMRSGQKTSISPLTPKCLFFQGGEYLTCELSSQWGGSSTFRAFFWNFCALISRVLEEKDGRVHRESAEKTRAASFDRLLETVPRHFKKAQDLLEDILVQVLRDETSSQDDPLSLGDPLPVATSARPADSDAGTPAVSPPTTPKAPVESTPLAPEAISAVATLEPPVESTPSVSEVKVSPATTPKQTGQSAPLISKAAPSPSPDSSHAPASQPAVNGEAPPLTEVSEDLEQPRGPLSSRKRNATEGDRGTQPATPPAGESDRVPSVKVKKRRISDGDEPENMPPPSKQRRDAAE